MVIPKLMILPVSVKLCLSSHRSHRALFTSLGVTIMRLETFGPCGVSVKQGSPRLYQPISRSQTGTPTAMEFPKDIRF